MTPELKAILSKDFASFCRMAFRTLISDKEFGREPYLDHLCLAVDQLAAGDIQRLVVNAPPRHMKTYTASICGAAWILAHKPAARVMIVTNGETLAKDIAYKIREIIRAKWYKEVFRTRLTKDRAPVLDFATTAGGGVFAVPIRGRITGHGADVIIVDDPHEIDDATNIEKIEEVNYLFDTVIESRLDDPRHGRIMIIAHRIHEDDLSGHVLAQGGWQHVLLPLIATNDTVYDTAHGPWHRRRDELLRPNAFTADKIAAMKALRRMPNFETLYQQNPSGGLRPVKREYFLSFPPGSASSSPIVLSIDPGQATGAQNSFSVVQAWCCEGESFLLLDQWRQQCTYRELRAAYSKFARKHNPSAVILERTAYGTALSSDIGRRSGVKLEFATPDRSKPERLADHLELIEAGRICLPSDAEWREEYIDEFVRFPRSKFSDQVDATTQYLTFIRNSPHLQKPPPRAIGICSSRSLSPTPSNLITHWPPKPPSPVGGSAVGCIGFRSRWPR